MEKFYSAEEIIKQLGIARKTLANWVRAGHFPCPIKIGRRIFWKKEVIDHLDGETQPIKALQH